MITLNVFLGKDSFDWNVGWRVGQGSRKEFFILEMLPLWPEFRKSRRFSTAFFHF